MNASLLLQISRPGLWLVFIWLYIWPTGGNWELMSSLKFWLGFVYITFPLNLLVYGMNDLVDTDTDSKNKRKGNYVFGAKASLKQMGYLPFFIALFNLPFMILFGLVSGDWLFWVSWFLSAFLINAAYNWKPLTLSRRAPWELPTMILGHLLIPLLSCHLNKIGLPGNGSWIFHCLLLARSHIWLEIMDINEDSESNKRTIAVVIGEVHALTLVVVITFLESFIGFVLLKSNLLGFFSLFGALVLITMTIAEKLKLIKVDKRHACISQSVVGVIVMIVLWLNGTIVNN